MQFQPETAARLVELYRRMRRHFGYCHPWWPGTPFQIAITAVLVQQCDWSIVWEAVLQLPTEDIHTLKDLAEAEPERLQELLRKVVFAPTKSARLVSNAQRILDSGFDSFEEFLSSDRELQIVRREVLTLPGIGPETADAWLNFASTHPVFVVDTYTRRIFERLNLIPGLTANFWRKGSYRDVQDFFEVHLLTQLGLYDEFELTDDIPREVALLRDYHGLLVELAKHHCFKSNPSCFQSGRSGWPNYPPCLTHCLSGECSACPLSSICRFPMS